MKRNLLKEIIPVSFLSDIIPNKWASKKADNIVYVQLIKTVNVILSKRLHSSSELLLIKATYVKLLLEKHHPDSFF